MHPAFWIASFALAVAVMLRAPLNGPAAAVAETVVSIGGGLPHGAYDIALLRRAVALDRSALMLAVGGYVAIAMAMIRFTVPLIALVLFLAVAAMHFGEDWTMLDEPFLRFAAGAAVIAAPTIGHPAAVTALFVAMSDGRATAIARTVAAIAPVALLITAVGVAVAWREGSRAWAAATALCLILLVILPPIVGFALFFVFLYSPRHLAEARTALGDMTRARWLATGALLTGAAILDWRGLETLAPRAVGATLSARAFRLLASVAIPALLLSRRPAARVDRPGSSHAIPAHQGLSIK